MKNYKLTQKGNDIKSPLLYDYMVFFFGTNIWDIKINLKFAFYGMFTFKFRKDNIWIQCSLTKGSYISIKLHWRI